MHLLEKYSPRQDCHSYLSEAGYSFVNRADDPYVPIEQKEAQPTHSDNDTSDYLQMMQQDLSSTLLGFYNYEGEVEQNRDDENKLESLTCSPMRDRSNIFAPILR